MRRLSELRAATAERTAASLEAGYKAAFSTAALVGAIAVGAGLLDRYAPAGLTLEPANPPNTGTIGETAEAEGLEAAESVIEVTPPVFVSAPLSAEPALEDAIVTAVVLHVPASALPPIIATAPIPFDPIAASLTPPIVSDAHFTDYALNLDGPRLFSNQDDEVALDGANRANAPGSLSDRMEAIAGNLATIWEPPSDAVRDVSLFIASDDEAVSWSMTERSPNFGTLAYEADRVDIGNIAAGVALTLPDARVAAGYMERDLDMRLGMGMDDPKQSYTGVVVTLQN